MTFLGCHVAHDLGRCWTAGHFRDEGGEYRYILDEDGYVVEIERMDSTIWERHAKDGLVAPHPGDPVD